MPQRDTIKHMQDIRPIIKQRIKTPLTGMLFAVVVCILVIAQDLDRYLVLGLIITGFIVLLGSILCIVNARNYPEPRPSYRSFNKVVYIYLVKVLIVFSVIDFLVNLKRGLNPFEQYKNPDALSPSQYLAHAGLDAASAYVGYKQLKPAQQVEQYFQWLESSQGHSTAATNTPQLPMSGQNPGSTNINPPYQQPPV